ncbi:hypothetical protein KIN20_003689 [Parelaphostrongylus tenuis]|nr:hypothetical protein KIN20_003689 [Parelaphostrongylus tenuis]
MKYGGVSQIFLSLYDKLIENNISTALLYQLFLKRLVLQRRGPNPATSREVAVRRARQLERFLKRVI